MKKGTKLYSMLTGKCPKCHEGSMWNFGAFKISKMSKMNKNCSHCGCDFEPQPSFYEGAMYVSYAIQVALIITVFTAFNVLYEEPNLTAMMTVTIVGSVLFAPLTFRLSRNIWANFFIDYDKKVARTTGLAEKAQHTTVMNETEKNLAV